MLSRVVAVVALVTALSGCNAPSPTTGAASGQVTIRSCAGPGWPKTPCQVQQAQGTKLTFQSHGRSPSTTSTDRKGRYFINLAPGTYAVTVGFASPGQVTISSGKTLIADYQLTVIAG